MNTIKFKRLTDTAKLPTYAHPGEDAAFDVYAAQPSLIPPLNHGVIPLGIASEIPPGFWVKLEGKSGLASSGIAILGGVIDSGYRGEWCVVVLNTSYQHISFNSGYAIAQGVIHAKPQFQIEEVTELSESKRGEHGFGSGHRSET